MAGGFLDAGILKQGGTRSPGWTNNIGLARVNVATNDDSIKITGADGTEFSNQNFGWVTIPDVTTGRLKAFSITSDVTIALVGAHWGAGGKGNLTDQKLVVYALNNNGSLVWGVSVLSQNHLGIVLDADDSATGTDITSSEKVLVNSALSADAQATMVGWFKADFDDTGGGSEDIWSIGGGTPVDKDINVGFQDIPLHVHYNSNDSATTQSDGATDDRRDYEDRVEDTHHTVTVGSWLFTAPFSGIYSIEAGQEFAAGAWGNVNFELSITIGSSGSAPDIKSKTRAKSVATFVSSVDVSGQMNLAKGDTVKISIFQNSGVTLTWSGDAAMNHVTITSIGQI